MQLKLMKTDTVFLEAIFLLNGFHSAAPSAEMK